MPVEQPAQRLDVAGADRRRARPRPARSRRAGPRARGSPSRRGRRARARSGSRTRARRRASRRAAAARRPRSRASRGTDARTRRTRLVLPARSRARPASARAPRSSAPAARPMRPTGRLGLARLDPARELGPRAEAVLLRDHPLRVGQPEALARPLAERLLDARDRLGLARARTRGRAPSPACGTTRGRAESGSSWCNCMTNLLRRARRPLVSGRKEVVVHRPFGSSSRGGNVPFRGPAAPSQRPRKPSRRSSAPSDGRASSRPRPR